MRIINWMGTRCLVNLLCISMLAFSGQELIGTAAPEWDNDRWINSEPLTLSKLKGKVVLIRFFMDANCPLCKASAPHLNAFYDAYKNQGLVVIGMYTPKPQPRPTATDVVQEYVKAYGFTFPVAIDDDWRTLKKFWLDRVVDADYTSVSLLIDRQGVIRFIHPGGAYSEADAITLKKKIEELISKP